MDDKKRIVLVEDNGLLSGMLSDELREEGCEVYQAFDGEKGLELIRSQKPDIVLLDLLMPKKDGFEVLKELKADDSTKNIPVVILTVSANEEKLEETMKMGAADALLKSHHTMKGIIDRVCGILKDN
jgi:DNA-binding response OmpR family regulator